MVEKADKIWMNGKFVNWDDAKVHVLTQALHYGNGVFEGIRCYKTHDGRSAIFRLKEHVQRMYDGCKILQMEVPFTPKEVFDACVGVVRENKLEECYIRPIMYAGVGAMGLYANNPTEVSIAAWKWGAYLGDEALEKGVRTKISSFNRHHVNVGMVQGKICGQYVSSILAKREAVNAGFDEAIMLDTKGYVAEATGENLFAIRDGVIRTPPFSSPILSGITRETIITIAKDLGMEVREETFTRDFLYLCDEVFFVGTAAEVTPVRELDNRDIGEGAPGPITKLIQEVYFSIVRGEKQKYQEWLTYVE